MDNDNWNEVDKVKQTWKNRTSVNKAEEKICDVTKNKPEKQTAWWNEKVKTEVKIKISYEKRYIGNRTEENT